MECNFADDATTSVSSGDGVVSVSVGGNVDISCTSTGVPVPTITWTLNNQETNFSQTNISTETDIAIFGAGRIEVTPGNVVSTLHIVNAQYPADDGVYVCTGSNTHAGVTTNSSAMVTVQVLGTLLTSGPLCTVIPCFHSSVSPEVAVTADSTRVGPNGDVTLTCSVTRGNPMTFNYTWIHVDTSTPLTAETSPTLSLSSFSEDDVGTYRCEVRNEAGLGMDNITIAFGGES